MRQKKDVLNRFSEVVNDNLIKLPDGEKMWVSYSNSKGEKKYILTGTPLRDKYIMYLVEETGRLVRLGECASPVKLEEKFEVLKGIRV